MQNLSVLRGEEVLSRNAALEMYIITARKRSANILKKIILESCCFAVNISEYVSCYDLGVFLKVA